MNPLNHVAIIMDGNGRWGLKHKNSRNEGHRAGLNTIENILKETIKQKIKFITLFTFSTENWKRPKKEIKYLFKLLENFLLNKIENLNPKNRKFSNLVLSISNLFGGDIKNSYPFAAAAEILASSWYVHGDVQSGVTDRFGRPSVWWKWGPAQGINTGDGLHAQAWQSAEARVQGAVGQAHDGGGRPDHGDGRACYGAERHEDARRPPGWLATVRARGGQ